MSVHQLFAAEKPQTNPAFDSLWSMWPVKSGKAIARAKFDGIVKGGFQTKTLDKSSGQFFDMELSATADEIIAGATAYLKSQVDKNTYKLKDGGKYIPHLSTWLSRAGWEDWL